MNILNSSYSELDRFAEWVTCDSFHAIANISAYLNRLRPLLSLREWQSRIEKLRDHQILDLIHQDPFIHRAYHKPRGYAGDAVMLDMMYDQQPPRDWVMTDVAAGIFRFGMQSPAPVAVRDRRLYIASEIDTTLAANPQARILSVACGHMRELELVNRFHSASFVGLDQDRLSLQAIPTQAGCNLQTQPLSVKDILSGRHSLGRFDLIYSLGLYDYFSQPMATKVTSQLFDLLNPAGRLIIGNFAVGLSDAAFMECYMDWWLTYREETAMWDLISGVPTGAIAQSAVHSRSQASIWYLVVQSAG